MECTVAALPKLRHVWIELTRRCNLQCVHCYVDAGPDLPLSEGMTTDNWLEIIQSARMAGCKTVQFIGGEPLLYPNLEVLLQESKRLGFESIEIFTNATRITADQINLFKKYEVKIALSFYALSAECHERITGVKGSYRRTLQAIEHLLEADISLRVGIIQVTQSEEEIAQAKEWLRDLGIDRVGVDHMRAIGRGDTNQSFSDPLAQLPHLCGACSDGKLCITSTGLTFPCIMARAWPVGDARDGLSSILDGEELSAFRVKQKEHLSSFRKASHIDDEGCGPDHPCIPDIWP